MVKLLLSFIVGLVANAAAFVPTSQVGRTTTLKASSGIWDPMGLYELGSGEAFDTFPNVFPNKQYLDAAEIKNGRMAMLGWTGVWATTKVNNHISITRN